MNSVQWMLYSKRLACSSLLPLRFHSLWFFSRQLIVWMFPFFFILCFSMFCSSSVAATEKECDRLCKAQRSVYVSPSRAIMDQLEGQMEQWASFLMEVSDAPTYLTFMDSYQLMLSKDLSLYGARYLRRKLRGKELTELYTHLSSHQDQALFSQLTTSLSVNEDEVNQYVRRLMWVRMREARRYLIRRLDEVYGLSRLSYVMHYHSREFIGQFMLQQAERWSMVADQTELKSFQDQITHWLMSEIDVDPNQFQSSNYHRVISRLTYVLRNVSDQELRDAINYYQHPQYQAMLVLIEKAWALHFQRLMVKNSLSGQDSPTL